MISFSNDWDEILDDEFKKDYYLSLREFLKSEYSTRRIYPPMNDIYNALRYTSYEDTRVVILGQDPYHGQGQAHGLSFSVPDNMPAPPSLKNIFKEIESDLGIRMSGYPNLEKWARQGVLLLNAVLTVRSGEAASHSKIGWEEFTDAVIRYISDNCTGVVFLLWGNFARSKRDLIDRSRHHVLEAAHPSPLARGAFFGCRHFSQTNNLLTASGRLPIDWTL
jgi:uracil-DNA glycosylase